MLDELDDEQRARLCILEQVLRLSESSHDVFDMLRMASWVEIGCDPDANATEHIHNLEVGRLTAGIIQARMVPADHIETVANPWEPAVR